MPGTSTSSSIAGDDDQRDRRPAPDEADRQAQGDQHRADAQRGPDELLARPGAQAGSSASAASIEEAEKTMTRPMASSRPGRRPAPGGSWSSARRARRARGAGAGARGGSAWRGRGPSAPGGAPRRRRVDGCWRSPARPIPPLSWPHRRCWDSRPGDPRARVARSPANGRPWCDRAVTARRSSASRRRTGRARRRRPSPVTSQNRTMTVFSVQPASSKWWCSGAIRKTRRRVARKNATWMTTDSVTATNSPPSTISSSSVRVTMARPESRPPRASEPVSPMKIRAGLVFHHRKPRHAPMPGGRDQRDVERVADGVAALDQLVGAVVGELPEGDERRRRRTPSPRSRRPARRGRR